MMKKKYNDLELDYNLSLFSDKTIKFLKYAWKDSKAAPEHCQYIGMKLLFKSRWLRFLDMCWCYVRFGAPTHNYKFFEFYKYNNAYRDTFLTSRRSTRILQKQTDINTYLLFKDKAAFNKSYSMFIKRKWMVIDEKTNVEQFLSFVESCKEIIVKPIDDQQGHGIFKLDSGACSDSLKQSFEICKRSGRYVCEEIVKNEVRLQSINPTSLNTIRINTFLNSKNELIFLGAGLRCGMNDSVVDNWASGGVFYPINIEEGIIDGYGLDKKGNKYCFHPSTRIKMIGLEIPDYKKLLPYIEKVAMCNTNAKLVGWDIAVTEDGFELIEGNIGADEYFVQPHGVGVYKYLIRNW